MIRDVCALSRLWFILSVATLYVSAQGVQVVDRGKRRWVDTHWFRGNSYFRIGWDWVKAALINGWKLIYSVSFSSHRDPTKSTSKVIVYNLQSILSTLIPSFLCFNKHLVAGVGFFLVAGIGGKSS